MSNTKKIKTKKKKEVEKVDTLTQTVRDSLASMGRKVNPYQEQLLVQVLKSFLVGGLATIVDIIIYCILCHFINPLLANVISMGVTIVLGLLIGIKYVYDEKYKKTSIRQYLILNGIGFLVTEGMLFGLTSIRWNAILIKVLAIILVLVIKILIRRFIFSKQKIS
ncbi:MAG: GtrA family protein [Bacilli bacterium]|nr:GtrA family protein [Bacilli bacterium]